MNASTNVKNQALRGLFALVLLFGAYSPVKAQLVDTVSSSGRGIAPFSSTIDVPSFDSNLGTLTGVTLSFTANIDADLSVPSSYYIQDGFTTFANLDAGAIVSLVTPDGQSVSLNPTVTSGFPTMVWNVPLAAFVAPDVNGNLSGFTGYNVGPNSAPIGLNVDPSSLGLYELAGGGNYQVQISAYGNAEGTPSPAGSPGQALISGTLVPEAFVTATYTYTPIPEPSTYAAILGAAVLGFAVVRRRQPAA